MPVAEPRDEIDDWLADEVTPLYPPAGSLERIRRRARQRRTRQATVTVACCAVVLAAAVAAPTLISAATGHHAGSGTYRGALGIKRPPVSQPSSGGSSSRSSDIHGRPRQIRQHTTLAHSWTGAPAHFEPTSVTFVGTGSGSVLGAVIGQAGTPGKCATKNCTSLAGTANYGATWYGVSAPLTPGPDGSTGVSQLRFATLADGWAYGPALYATTGGGWPWVKESTGGQRVIDVEAAPATAQGPARAFAVFGSCTGTGSDYAAHCTSYSLWTSVAGTKSWTPVDVPAAYQQMSSANSAAPLLVIAGATTGYLITPSGAVLSGPTNGGSWRQVGTAPCTPGPASPAARTAEAPGAQFTSGPEVLLACDGLAGSSTATVLYRSADGTSWQSDGNVPASGTPTSLASAVTGQAVLTTTTGIWYLAGAGKSWQATDISGGSPAGGFSYVGMTTATNGVAVPADAQLGEIFVTTDGGQTWTPAPISG
jgi:hypothetical protein